ncbi:Crp/Fnr family transcriptional regulator [Comamonas terrigena]|uniref:Crp/Fnr family transcriptional regulator n=1 Tax=Comamonas terrigena TaxID=32013 RepID=UPI00244A8A23|nr:Crp/Fnr family transcriptional regulator [Comamonas terrigena]MDH1292723.1 Crp/Fnr family transcriptional regulator [Comamonas terrigena]
MQPSTPRSGLALQSIELFRGLSPACLQHIANRCAWWVLEPHTQLLQNQQVAFVCSGSLRIATYSANGKEVSFSERGAGSHIGDIAVLEGHSGTAFGTTLEPTVLATLDRDAFTELLHQEPLLAHRVIHSLTARIRRLSERVVQLSTLGVPARLHAELLRLCEAAGTDAQGQAHLQPLPSHAILASMIGANREQVTRALNALAKQGLVRKTGAHSLSVLDVAALRRRVMAGE